MDREYWTKQLREAEAELEAATKRTEVDAAAKKLQRAKGGAEGARGRAGRRGPGSGASFVLDSLAKCVLVMSRKVRRQLVETPDGR